MFSKFSLLFRARTGHPASGATSIMALSVLAAALLSGAPPLIAQSERQPAWGTTAAPTGSPIHEQVILPTLEPSSVEVSNADANSDAATASITSASYKNASYGSGGAALRNRASASLSISGVTGPIQAAFLYWAVITTGTPPSSVTSLTFNREYPGSASATLKGTAIGSGAVPCWIGNTITVYRAAVSTALATGNGVYRVTISSASGTAGSTDGSDPWKVTKLPLWEGASLVIVGQGTGTVAIYDQGLAGHTFTSQKGISYALNLPVTASGKLTLFDSIGADGQVGVSRLGVVGLAQETTAINSAAIAGVDSAYNDSDWNGSSGYPLPQLWDDVGHDITSVTPAGTKVLNVEIANFFVSSSNYDCMTPVANLVEVH